MYIKPPLPYAYNALIPYYNEQTLKIHEKLHQGYVDNYNLTLTKLQNMRSANDYNGIKALEKDLAFYGSGAVLHTLFFENLRSAQNANIPKQLLTLFENEFDGASNFKKEFSEAATTIEGNGWIILGYNMTLKRYHILTAENHQNLTIWNTIPILVLDMWEHSYFLQYTNHKVEYIENLWNILNWDVVNQRYTKIQEYIDSK